jgi:hypothetical protein
VGEFNAAANAAAVAANGDVRWIIFLGAPTYLVKIRLAIKKKLAR